MSATPPVSSGPLEPDVDYFYCEECKQHIPCRRTDTGYWEVECGHCIGECSVCHCPLRVLCFGFAAGAPPIPTSLRPRDDLAQAADGDAESSR